MGRRSSFWSLLAILLTAAASPAVASTQLSPPVSGATILSFGAVYEMGGRRVTHRGMDVRGSVAETVRAACGGSVSFVGEVPADGGGRARAVTVRTADGLLVCVSPLASTRVSTGDSVVAGDAIGELAGSGDGSCSDVHAHLSVRDGGLYIDPAPLLAGEVAPVIGDGSAESGSGEVGSAMTAGELAGSMNARPGSASDGGASAPEVWSSPVRAVSPNVDSARIRAAYAASLEAFRSPQRRMHARLLGEPRLMDSFERSSLSLAEANLAWGELCVLAAVSGLMGAVVARKRLGCMARQLIGRLN